MTDRRCIICLESGSEGPELRRLCPGCAESLVCRGCLSYVLENGFEDQISNCPICKRPTGFHFEPVLQPTFQILTCILWYVRDLEVSPWKIFSLMFATYNLYRSLCIRQDRQNENSPRTLKLKWSILMSVIHVPYFLYFFPRTSVSEDTVLNEYLICQFGIPVVFGTLIWIYKTAKGMIRR